MPHQQPVQALFALNADQHKALTCLQEAHAAAVDLGVCAWTLACQLPNLRAMGISETVLRWLVVRGLAEHRHEITTPRQRHRTFLRAPNLCFTESSCFVISAAAIGTHLRAFDNQQQHLDLPVGRGGHVPHYDRARRTLFCSGQIVKRFRVPAGNQELILRAFEEEGWPPHLDDPLPPAPDIEAKKRIHDAIYRLNNRQQARLLLFLGDGTGHGVNWRQIDDRSTAD